MILANRNGGREWMRQRRKESQSFTYWACPNCGQLGLEPALPHPAQETVSSVGCSNKSPQTYQLQTIEVYFFTVPWGKNLRSRCQQSHSPSEASREDSFIACRSLWGCWRSSAFGHTSLCSVFTSPSPLYLSFLLSQVCLCLALKKTLIIEIRAHSDKPR